MCGGGGSPRTPLANQQGKIAQAQWMDYQRRFVPIESEMLEYADPGTSILTGQEDSATPGLGEAYQDWSHTTEDQFLGKDKWLRKEDKVESRIAELEAKGKTGGKKYKKKLKKLAKLQGKIADHTVEGQTITGKNMTLAGALGRADDMAQSVSAAQHGQGLRDAARYGGLTEAQQEYYDRKSKLGASKSRMTLRNTTRDAYRDRGMGISAQMMGVGRGLSNSAIQGLSAASGLEASRNATNQQMKQQQQSSTMSAIGTLAAGAMIAMSTIKAKENVKPVDMQDLIEKLREIDLYEFDYKDGFGVAGKHYGPIVELIPEEFRDGDFLNMYNIMGTMMASMQAMQARIDELESKE